MIISLAQELDIEQQRSSDNFRAIKDHEHALDSLHKSIDIKAETLKRSVDSALQDLRQRVDNETRSRMAFEHNIKELYSDVRKVIQNQERSILDRLDSTRQTVLSAVDRERQEREKSLTGVVNQMRDWEKAVKETEFQIMNSVSNQLSGMDEKIQEDRDQRQRYTYTTNNRRRFENSLRGDVEDGIRTVQTSVVKRANELNDSQNELKQRVGHAVQSLQESNILVEKTLEAKINVTEGVLRAEIKSRMDAESDLKTYKTSMDLRLESLKKV